MSSKRDSEDQIDLEWRAVKRARRATQLVLFGAGLLPAFAYAAWAFGSTGVWVTGLVVGIPLAWGTSMALAFWLEEHWPRIQRDDVTQASELATEAVIGWVIGQLSWVLSVALFVLWLAVVWGLVQLLEHFGL